MKENNQARQIFLTGLLARKDSMNKVIIVGGGAAGMLCSIIAARNGCEVFLYEKNEKLGKKLILQEKEDAMLQITVR